MTNLCVASLSVRYGNAIAVENISFEVAQGEWVTLLGPSGCGKSTTLNALAGLEKPISGRISVGDKVYFDGSSRIWLEAEHRNLGLVFQSYALWPHMTVEQNCSYPLKLRKIARSQRQDAVRDALTLVGMEQFIDRYPHQLSGGQQQRVALARTLVYRPKILLLDEPLSNLDARVRDKARDWLKHLQQKVGLTTIFVTHDQVEALALSDRIIVMNKGRIVQDASPIEIYEKPASQFVADFVGTMSFLSASVQDGGFRLSDGQEILLAGDRSHPNGTCVTVAFRPEAVEFCAPRQGSLTGEILSASYMGGRYSHIVQLADAQVRVEAVEALPLGPISMSIKPEAILVF